MLIGLSIGMLLGFLIGVNISFRIRMKHHNNKIRIKDMVKQEEMSHKNLN